MSPLRSISVWVTLFVVLGVVAALMLAPGLAIGPSLDAAVFTWIGDRLLAGSTLYVDVWDHKPPGAYAVFAIAQLFPGLSPWPATWLLSVLASAGTGLALANALVRFQVRPTIIAITALATTLAATQYLTALGGGLTETVAALPTAAALAVGLASTLTTRRLAVIGVLLGLALLISFQVAHGVLVICGLAIAATRGQSRWKGTAVMAAGFALPFAISLIALAMTGALGAAYEAIIVYGAAYRASTAAFGAELSAAPAAWTGLSYLFLITAAGLGGLVCWRARGQRRWVLIAMVGWLVVATASLPIQGRFIAHYAIPLVIPLGVLAGLGLEGTASRWERAGRTARSMLVLPLLITLVISLTAGHLGSRQELVTNGMTGDRVRAAVRYVLEQTGSDDAILVWGNRPEIYLAADREAAIPYPYMFPLATEGYVSNELINGLVARMRADPPELVIDAGSTSPGAPGFLPLLIPRPVAQEGREIDLLAPLRDFVRDDYLLVAEIEGWPIYRVSGGVRSR